MVKYMKIFNDIRNFINEDSFKIIIYNDLINIVNYKELLDINVNNIKIKSNKIIDITGKNLCIVKLLDNELLIKGIIERVNINE